MKRKARKDHNAPVVGGVVKTRQSAPPVDEPSPGLSPKALAMVIAALKLPSYLSQHTLNLFWPRRSEGK